jgi:hypothetical protein
MNALRQLVKPKNYQVIVDLPEDLNSEEELEVIILPVRKFQKISRKNALGKYQGQIKMSPDFDEPLEDFKEYME